MPQHRINATNILRQLTVAASGWAAAGACLAVPTLVFDNFDASGSFLFPYSATTSPIARIAVATTTTISNIAVLERQATAGNLKFLIFNASTNALLLATASQAFVADGATASYKMSGDFSFTLQQGVTYFIGAISSVDASWSFDGTANTQSGFTSVVANGNVSSFASPVISGSGSFDPDIRLYTASPVPEPATAALWAMAAVVALLGAGVAGRRQEP